LVRETRDASRLGRRPLYGASVADTSFDGTLSTSLVSTAVTMKYQVLPPGTLAGKLVSGSGETFSGVYGPPDALPL